MSEATKQTRATAKRFFTRAEAALLQTLKPDALEDTIHRRFEELCKRWDQVQDSHDAYICVLGDISEEQIASEDQWLNDLSNRFHQLELQVDQEIHKRKSAAEENIRQIKEEKDLQASMTARSAETVPHKSNCVQLERMKFSQFDGDIRKYPRFKEEFHTHIKPLCNFTQLPFVLKSYLVDKVKDEVDNVENDYNALWERLDEKYGDKGHLIDSIMSDIKCLKGSSDNDNLATLDLIKTIERAHRDLIRLGEGDQMDNATIISMIEQKLPERILDEWVKEISSKAVPHRNRFSSLMALLAEWRKRIEYKVSAIRSREADTKGKMHHHSIDIKGSGKARQDSATKSKCWIHSSTGEHPIWKCRVFENKSAEERMDLAKLHKACFLCLEVGHDADKCTILFRCNIPGCKGKHNRLLHDAIVAGSTNHSDNSTPDNGSTMLPTQEI